jgi:hypothetical protein
MMRLPNLRSRVRSLMLTVVIVAAIAWVCVLSSRRAHFLKFSQHCRGLAAFYARAESQNVDAVAQVADVEREVTSARPPAAGSDERAWSAYREYLSDLQTKLTIAKARLDEHERYGAVRRSFERLAAKYERAAINPWRSVEADTWGAE